MQNVFPASSVLHAQKYKAVELSDTKLVLSSQPVLHKALTVSFLAPWLMVPVFFGIAYIEGNPVSDATEFLKFIAPEIVASSLVMPIIVVLAINYRVYEFDVDADTIKYSKGRFKTDAHLEYCRKLTEILQIDVSSGSLQRRATTTISPSLTDDQFVIQLLDQEHLAAEWAKWITQASMNARLIH